MPEFYYQTDNKIGTNCILLFTEHHTTTKKIIYKPEDLKRYFLSPSYIYFLIKYKTGEMIFIYGI